MKRVQNPNPLPDAQPLPRAVDNYNQKQNNNLTNATSFGIQMLL